VSSAERLCGLSYFVLSVERIARSPHFPRCATDTPATLLSMAPIRPTTGRASTRALSSTYTTYPTQAVPATATLNNAPPLNPAQSLVSPRQALP
jgi:hypothetical protein